ncbi:MAG: class I SAM-dependent methyltransferase [Bacteroidota bacterium]
MNKVAEFYDDYSAKQLKAGVHKRHIYIKNWLVEKGLRPDSKILELGCGIGTVTSLILPLLNENGKLLAVDISPESIALAQQRLSNYKQASFICADVVDLEMKGEEFDFIILPDVLEHIPIEVHNKLFRKLREVCHQNTTVLIHIPFPNYLQHLIDSKAESLQIIDQPLFTNELLLAVYNNGFYLHFLTTYSIWVKEGDAQLLVLKVNPKNKYSYLGYSKPNIVSRGFNAMKRYIADWRFRNRI